MKVQFILDNLYRKFDLHKYQLSNSYIYKWESDFFSVLKSGYTQEVEIKTSYTDFKADFKKISKHRLIEAKFNKKELTIHKGDLVYEVTIPARQGRRRHFPEVVHTRYRSNRNDERIWKKQGYEFTHVSTEIHFVTPDLCPNKLLYICPPDIIPVEDIPKYAGLSYIYPSGRIVTKKRPPHIHKEIQNIDKILLDKFYYKCKNLMT